MRQLETRMFTVPARNDEVDLREMLFAGVCLVQKYRVAIVSIIIFGIASGAFYYFLHPARFTASIICAVPYLGRTDIKNMVEAITQYSWMAMLNGLSATTVSVLRRRGRLSDYR